MGDSKIHLMAFEPKGGVKTEVHVVGMPPLLQEALFALFPPRGEKSCLGTDQLKSEMRCWLDQAVELKPVHRGELVKDWLVALRPVNLERLCNIIANWLYCSCSNEVRASSLYREATDLLKPSLFAEHVEVKNVALFDEEGRPAKEAGELTFPAFSAQVANALVGKPLYLPGGECLTFSRLSRGGKKGYELMSDIRWLDDCPFAFVLQFHVETLPVGRKARLNVDVKVRSFIHKPWTDGPHPHMNGKSVNAYVRTDGGTLRVVPYRYDKEANRPEWNKQAKRNFEGANHDGLPDMDEYFANMGAFAAGERSPQILSPCSTSARWAADSKVASGVPMRDKADIFALLADALSDYVEPVAPASSIRLTHLKTAFDDAGAKMRSSHPDEAQAAHDAWASANRRRLAACTGESRVAFELIGTTADDAVLDAAREEIVYFLGPEGTVDGVEVTIADSRHDGLLGPLGESSSANAEADLGAKAEAKDPDVKARQRWFKIEKALGKANGLTACIVALPSADAFEKLGNGFDPKVAIRMGLARTGRLSQFLVPKVDETFEHRVRAAVRDLMRQLGFVPEFKAMRGGIDLAMPVVGLRIYGSPIAKKKARFPLAVRVEAASGAVSVDCPLIGCGRVPYWKAQLELARISTSSDYGDKLRGVNGLTLKRMVDRMKLEAVNETLLLVQAYGCMRYPDWWPGISDKGLSRGGLYYGPACARYGDSADADGRLFDLGDSQLNVLRVRSGADGEVPDYFTDERPLDEYGRSFYCKQGLFPMDGYALALTARPHATDYTLSFKNSKLDDPSQRYAEKTLNEYCLLTSDDEEKMLEYAKYAEALRGSMVQLVKSDMRVNLPAPLHLAEAMEEYVWAPEKEGRRRR